MPANQSLASNYIQRKSEERMHPVGSKLAMLVEVLCQEPS